MGGCGGICVAELPVPEQHIAARRVAALRSSSYSAQTVNTLEPTVELVPTREI